MATPKEPLRDLMGPSLAQAPKGMDYLGFRMQLQHECVAMARHAFASGLKIPAQLMRPLQELLTDSPQEKVKTSSGAAELPRRPDELKMLAQVHGQLARLVEPATPRTLLLVARNREQKGFFSFLGPIPLVRGLMAAALVFLTALVAISLSENVDGQVNWSQEDGFELLLEELFLIAAAGLGATFTALFQANRYLVEGVFDPKYDASYWIRIVLGVIAGMILAMLIPIEGSGSLKELTKPTLAMLGGFSVAVVYRILDRMVNAVESLVRGDSKDMVKQEGRVAQIRAQEEQTEQRLQMASELIRLKDRLASPDQMEDAQQHLQHLVASLVPADDAALVESAAPESKAATG